MNFNDLKTKPKILFGVCSPLVLLVALGAIAIYNINIITKTAGWVDHTRVVLAESAAIIGSAVDMETGMRGYLLAGKDGFLDPYNSGQKAAYEQIAKLKETVSDNPGQMARLDEVENTLSAWQAEVTEPTIQLRRDIGNAKTMDDMADLVGEARGKVFFDKFRGQISTFISREQSLLEKRRADFGAAQTKVTEQFGLVQKTIDWVAHTYKVLASASELLANAVNMETGMRGFMLAGEDEFLNPYNDGKKAFFVNMKALQQTVSDNPAQIERLKKAEKLISNWNKQVTEPAISLRRRVTNGSGSLAEVEALVRRKEGKKFFDAFRGIITEFGKAEAKLLVTRQSDAKDAGTEVTTNLKTMKDNEAWVTHTYKVIGTANSALSAAVDMETGMRGYLLAGQEDFLAPYNGGQKGFKSITDGLLETVKDNPSQVELMTGIQNTIGDWVSKVTEPTIALRRKIGDAKTMNDMAALIGEARGKVFFDKFRNVMGEFQAEEHGLMEQRAADNVKTVDRTFMLIAICIGIALLIGIGLAWFIGNAIANPILSITGSMRTLADGDTTVDVPGGGRSDEIGAMADAVVVFRENMIKADQMIESEKKSIARRDARSKAIDGFLSKFNEEVSEVLDTVLTSSSTMATASQSMSSNADLTSQQAAAVAAASEQAASNVATVAAAAEELSASVNEINRQIVESQSISDEAKTEGKKTNEMVEGLSESVGKISDVVSLINDIADQTNLLALNATIEAARAGDAGKGFAVVASEVKNLANQTARATEEIGSQIETVQAVTRESVDAIGRMTTVVDQMSNISNSIADSIEQQGAAVQEIASNVEQAALGTNEVNRNISGVSQAATETGSSSKAVIEAAQAVTERTSVLRSQVDEFLSNVRTSE